MLLLMELLSTLSLFEFFLFFDLHLLELFLLRDTFLLLDFEPDLDVLFVLRVVLCVVSRGDFPLLSGFESLAPSLFLLFELWLLCGFLLLSDRVLLFDRFPVSNSLLDLVRDRPLLFVLLSLFFLSDGIL